MSKSKISPLINITLLLISFTLFVTCSHAALSATTANTIQGTKPYIPDLNVIKDKLGFKITNGDTTVYYPNSDDYKNEVVGKFPPRNDPFTITFNQFNALTAAEIQSSLSDSDFSDDEEDGNFILKSTVTDVQLKWYYSGISGSLKNEISASDLVDSPCDYAASEYVDGVGYRTGPYYVKISAKVKPITEFGAPAEGDEVTVETDYGLVFFKTVACYYKPLGLSIKSVDDKSTSDYSAGLGFLPGSKFPETGFDGASFHIILSNGMEFGGLLTPNNSNAAIGGDANLVVLKNKGSFSLHFNRGGGSGLDMYFNNIAKWFVPVGNGGASRDHYDWQTGAFIYTYVGTTPDYKTANDLCSAMSARLPTANELSNAPINDNGNGFDITEYTRETGHVFSEWSAMKVDPASPNPSDFPYYSQWANWFYWTTDPHPGLAGWNLQMNSFVGYPQAGSIADAVSGDAAYLNKNAAYAVCVK